MKIYRISKWAFYGICILILLLPVSRHWRLLAGGEKTVGTVTEFKQYSREIGQGRVAVEYASEIRYNVGDTTYLTFGPRDLEYRKGREIPVLYEPGNPQEELVLTTSAIYLNPYAGVSLLLLILWAAFYLSFNSYAKRKREGVTTDLADSPYRPSGKRRSGTGKRDRKGHRPGSRMKYLRVFLPVVFAASFLLVPRLQNPAFSRTIRVEPAAGDEAINTILDGAQPGDTILFTPGTYRGPFLLEGVHGKPDLPVVIRGEGARNDQWRRADPGSGRPRGEDDHWAVIDGRTEPGTGLDNEAFRLTDCSWIVIEGFTIRNCWTDLVRAHDVSYLSLRNSHMEGGKRAIYATGRGSHHFLVEGCTWEQDQRVWTHEEGYSWDEVHHGIHSHYNGSIFQGYGISGVFVLRDNVVRNTFNAFRLSLIGDGGPDPLAGTNGEIYRNTVINNADNVLEPEVHALNLHFYHNRMINGHAFISITEVSGGEIYIYGNTALTIPGEETGWTIFKISSRRTTLTRPLYIFNNSWWVNFDMVGSPRNIWKNDHVNHFNNACYSAASDSFGIYNLGEDNFFDYDCSNVPFPEILTRNGHERHGIVADPGFRDPLGGDFRLAEGSPCIDRGMEHPELLPFIHGDAPDIGAFDGGLPVEGPPFRFVQPEMPVPFQEMPRITRHRMDDRALRVWFSAPLSASTVGPAVFRLIFPSTGPDRKVEPGQEAEPRPEVVIEPKHARAIELEPEHARAIELEPELSADGHCLTLSSREIFDLPEGFYLQIENRPAGTSGMPMTGWASAIPVKFSTVP